MGPVPVVIIKSAAEQPLDVSVCGLGKWAEIISVVVVVGHLKPLDKPAEYSCN